MPVDSKNIFLIDAVGAFASIVALFIIAYVPIALGVPLPYLHSFMLVGCGCFAYSITCHFMRLVRWRVYLKIIALLNLSYCLLTAFLLFQIRETLTLLGGIYFMLEIIVIVALSVYELKLSNAKQGRNRAKKIWTS